MEILLSHAAILELPTKKVHNGVVMPVIKILGSLVFAVSLIAFLAVILCVSTLVESLHGTPVAQQLFYRAYWFDIFISLLWVNIFCATFTRYPFKKKHVGFVITHLGILLLLAGALLTRLSAIEGQMTLFESEAKNRMLQQGFVLRVSGSENFEKLYPIQLKQLRRPVRLEIPNALFSAQITQIIPQAVEVKSLEENPGLVPVNHAVEAKLSSSRLGLEQSVVLIENDPFDPGASIKSLGPATFRLESNSENPAQQNPTLRLFQESTGLNFNMQIQKNVTDAPWKEAGLKLSNIHYYPRARVEQNRLVNASESAHPNPAVEFEISDESGHRESHTKFTLFPDFNSLRGGQSNNVFGLNVRLDLDETSPAFIFSVTPDNLWHYRVRSSKNPHSEPKPLPLREKIPTGWMDMQVEVKQIFNHAQVSKSIKEDPDHESEIPGLQIDVTKKNSPTETRWLVAGSSWLVGKDKTGVRLAAELKSAPLPFSLALKDFRKIDYPGTTNPASFESDVVLTDPAEGITLERTIKMNKPLDYKGYRIFQSSYIQDDSLGEASVFSVAKNPGMALIYPGAALILVGVILLFYFHPFFSSEEKKSKDLKK